MKKVLYPTDFSENSLSVLPWAAQFCKSIKAEMVLFNAMVAPMLQTDGPIVNAEEIIEEQANFILDKLTKIAVETRNEFKIVVNVKTEYGFSAEAIANMAKGDNFDLIILSAKGDTTFLDAIFGNVTESLFEKSEIPILSIPVGLKFNPIKKAAFASSNIDYDVVQISELMDLLKVFKSKIKLVHITSGNDFESKRFDKFPSLEYVEIGGENKLDSISEYLQEENIDLVCVKRYKLPFFYRFFNKSFTENLFHHVDKPLLVFKDE